MVTAAWTHPQEPMAAMHFFLTALEEGPDPCARNTRHEMAKLLVIAFMTVLCSAT